jgi:predicted RNase H-like HicB family nuclease
MKQSYPTFIYDTRDGSEHSFLVYVPDMDIFTEGDDFTDAIEMARDAIGVAGISMEDNNEKLPMPSTEAKAIEMAKKNSDIVDFSQGILTYVDVDFFYYRRQIDMTTVRRNVSLPNWLNCAAEKAGVNVSNVLQEALISTLKLERRM